MYKAKRSHAELIKLRKTAKYLVIIKGMPQKEVAKIVGVSEKTISLWSHKDEWRKEIKGNIKSEGGVKAFISKFFMYLLNVEPGILTKVKRHWDLFLKNEEKEIDT